MELPDLKQLDKLIALCRKRGITTVKMGALELTLSESAPVKPKSKKQSDVVNSDPFQTDTPSEEELLYWSADGPLPTDTAKSE